MSFDEVTITLHDQVVGVFWTAAMFSFITGFFAKYIKTNDLFQIKPQKTFLHFA